MFLISVLKVQNSLHTLTILTVRYDKLPLTQNSIQMLPTAHFQETKQ